MSRKIAFIAPDNTAMDNLFSNNSRTVSFKIMNYGWSVKTFVNERWKQLTLNIVKLTNKSKVLREKICAQHFLAVF